MIDDTIRKYLLAQQFNAAVRAGAAIMSIYKRGDDYDIAIKSDHTPITIADRMAHNTIKESLGSTRIPILSEEGREMHYDERRNWELFWLVDPLDGTVEFIKGNNEFTVNIALMENNICISSVVYVPYHNKMYIAERGRGAWHRRPLGDTRHDRFRVAVSRSHQTEETHLHIDTLRHDYPDLEIVEQGSSYKFCLLAEGVVDYYIRTTTTFEWDTAAGELILAESGGSTKAYPSGNPLIYNKAELGNPWFVARR